MISHKYEDYSNRLGIRVLGVLVALLFWPAVVVAALWWWRSLPSFLGEAPMLSETTKTVLGILTVTVGGLWWMSRKLKWFNIPFGLDDPRRALVYPYAIYLLKFVMLGTVLLLWQMLIVAYAPQLEPYRAVAFWIAFAIMMLGVPSYIHRIVTLWKRKELSSPDAA